MANESLNNAVSVEARTIDAASVPDSFGWALKDYLVNQSNDVRNIAKQANIAAGGAYEAQLTNDDQNIVLDDHANTLSEYETRISAAEATLEDHETRISKAESELADHESRITNNETDISEIKPDYVSKKATSLQNIASPIDVSTSYSVNGVKVVGAQIVGWTAATGSAFTGVFNSSLALPVGAAYSQAEVTAIANALITTRQRLKAMEDALRQHGLIK
ncbi:MAG: phage tail protein [Plesiomonas shigelloides]